MQLLARKVLDSKLERDVLLLSSASRSFLFDSHSFQYIALIYRRFSLVIACLSIICVYHHSPLQPCQSFVSGHFNNLIEPLIRRDIQLIFLRHRLCQKPASHKMSALEPLDQWLRRRQTNQRIRIISLPGPLIRRTCLDIPTGRCVHG